MIRIEILVGDDCPYEDVQKALETQMQAIGFVRNGTIPAIQPHTADTKPNKIGDASPTLAERAEQNYVDKIKSETINETGTLSQETFDRVTLSDSDSAAVRGTLVTNTSGKLTAMDGDRKRGEAGPGHRRRTNQQIKDDEAYFASIASSGAAPLPPGVEERPLISTGGERISSEDAADEAAETAARKTDKPTIEDLRAAVGRYTEKFGPKASIENIRTILGKPIIEVPENEIAAAIARVEAAIADHTALEQPKLDESVFDGPADKPTRPVHATKADVVEAFKAYGKKYDGSEDAAKMIFTQQDLPNVLEQALGAGVRTLSKIPNTPEGFGKAMTAVYEAVRDNPFKRAVKS